MSEGLVHSILEELKELRALIGKVVFLPIPLGKKAPDFSGWQKVTYEATQEPDYQDELKAARARGGNIGAKLGPDSGRLFTLDIDSDELQAAWIKRVPWLGKTLTTRGKRGCQFWLRLEDDCDYPLEGIVNLKDGELKSGELRFGGGAKGVQSVIWGVHPDGGRYRIINRALPLVIGLADLDELGYRPGLPEAASPQPSAKQAAAPPEPNHNLEKRILAYLERCDESIAGDRGDDELFKTACKLVIGWDLSPDEALRYLRWYNERKCKPPWDEDRLKYKLKEADKQPGVRGMLRDSKGEDKSYKSPAQDDDEEEQEDKHAELLEEFQSALVTFGEFQKLDIPPYNPLYSDWFREADTNFVFGFRGSGKTWFIDILISHLTRGANIDESWNACAGQVHVVLVDGEMRYDDTRARLAGLDADPNFLHLLHHEVLFQRTGKIMNLSNPIQQQIVTELCVQKGAKVLVLETLSSLFRGMAEKDNDQWELVNQWLLDLRRKRIAVLIVSHAGWNSDHQRGGSRREDDAMTVIRVKEIADRPPGQRGAYFTTEFTKWRNVDSPPLVRQWSVKTEADGTVSFNCEELSFDAQVLARIQAGLRTAKDIAEEMGSTRTRVCRAVERLTDQKLVDKRGSGNRTTYEPRGFMRNEE